MFEQRKKTGLPAKLVAISVAGLLVGIGLCGAGSGIKNEGVSEAFFVAGAICFWTSCLLFFVGLVWIAIAAAFKERTDENV
jgi:hypothetical protein